MASCILSVNVELPALYQDGLYRCSPACCRITWQRCMWPLTVATTRSSPCCSSTTVSPTHAHWYVATRLLDQYVLNTAVCLFVRQSVCPSVCPSVRPSVRPSVHPSICPPVCPSVGPSVSSSIGPSVCPSVRPSICQSVHPSVHPYIRLSIHPSFRSSVLLSVRLSVCPSVRPSFRLSICRRGGVVNQAPVFKVRVSLIESLKLVIAWTFISLVMVFELIMLC